MQIGCEGVQDQGVHELDGNLENLMEDIGNQGILDLIQCIGLQLNGFREAKDDGLEIMEALT